MTTTTILGFALAGAIVGIQPLMGQVDSTQVDWRAIERALERNPYYLHRLPGDSALRLVHHAIRTREDGVRWAAYGVMLCRPEPSERDSGIEAEVVVGRQQVACLQSLWTVVTEVQASSVVLAVQRAAEVAVLESLAEAAIAADDLALATATADTLLRAYRDVAAWQWGNIVHNANQVLGRVALRRGELARAEQYLLAAGSTPGSPQLMSFGPRMPLARELLEVGNTTAILEYLTLVRRFWNHADAIAELEAAVQVIRNGGVPGGRRWR